MTNGIPHPFEIFWDTDEASYFIFVPVGCVLVNGVAATNDDVDNGNLALDFGETPPDKVYCHVKQEEDEESGEKSWKFTIDGEEEDEDAKWDILVATFGKEENDGQSYDVVCSAISLGGSGEFVGDMAGSEVIGGDGETILVTGHPGGVPQEETPPEQDSHSGLQFLTVSARTDEESGEKIPAKIIARIKGKDEDEDWGAKTLTVTPAEGSPQTAHFLGSKDIAIEIPAPIDPPDPLEGSDYIDVPTQGQDAGKILAKVSTPANQNVANIPNALLTHNTDQFVRSKKTFLGLGANDNALKKVVVDGPNGKIEAIAPSGGDTYKIVIDAGELAAAAPACGKKEIHVKKLTVNYPRAKTVDGQQVTSETYHILGCDDVTINEGDAIDKVESGTSTQSGEYTITPVTITLKDGTVLPAFNIKAKNGSGEKGDDGASVTGATAGTPVVEDNTTTTPITFTLSDGTTVGPVNVVSTNGVEASGSDYIDVGDGAGDTTKGQVKAKVPTDGSKGLVTTDTTQTIGGYKTFSRSVKIVYGSNGEGTYYPNAIYFKPVPGVNSWVAFYNPNDSSKILGEIVERGNVLEILATSESNGVLINAAADKTKLNNDPTVGTGDKSQKLVATTSWVNKKYNVAELVEGDNITLTPNENDPKKLTIAAQQPDISGKANAATGLTGATKCKITYNSQGIVTGGENLSASDLPTHMHTKDEITDFPTALKNPYALTFTGSASGLYDGSAAKTVNIPAAPQGEKTWTVDGASVTVNASAAKTIKSNVQSDWSATSGDAAILNKPSSLKNPNALTIKKSGSADVVYDGSAAKTITLEAGGATLDHFFSWEGTKKADIAASADIAVDSKTIQGSDGITVTEQNRVITISGNGSQVSGYTTPVGTYDYEVTGQEWDATNHRIVIHKVKKIYENGLLKTREAVADEYIQFVEETV